MDVYWDSSRNVWSFCPAQLGGSGGVPSSSSTTGTSLLSHLPTSTKLSSASLAHKRSGLELDGAWLQSETVTHLLDERQDSAALQVSFASNESSFTSTAVTTTATIGLGASRTDSSGQTTASSLPTDGAAIQVGPYICTPDADISVLIDVLQGYMRNTQNNLNSTTYIIHLNIHAAASPTDPTGSALQPAEDDLPQNSTLLSSLINNGLSEFLYTPSALADQRANLNASGSFFNTYADDRPDSSYFQVDTTDGHSSTPDGWPSEGFMELTQGKRLVFAIGQVDPQMVDYDFSSDAATIFPSHYLDTPTSITTHSNGTLASGCIFDPSVSNLAQVNSSWSYAALGSGGHTLPSSLPSILTEVSSLIACGTSPLLNETLNNVTADADTNVYSEYVQTAVWSWAPGQPINASSSSNLAQYRCAALNSISGFWEASPCGSTYYGACRGPDGPYDWTVTSTAAPYSRINLACPSNTMFDAPRTALDNAYLLTAWRAYQRSRDDDAGPLLWLDFNDLDVSACWVVGVNTTCPYQNSAGQAQRDIVVPVVAGVIVFVIAALTVLVKCAGNRRNTKRKRRRGGNGWDYEGVPQ